MGVRERPRSPVFQIFAHASPRIGGQLFPFILGLGVGGGLNRHLHTKLIDAIVHPGRPVFANPGLYAQRRSRFQIASPNYVAEIRHGTQIQHIGEERTLLHEPTAPDLNLVDFKGLGRRTPQFQEAHMLSCKLHGGLLIDVARYSAHQTVDRQCLLVQGFRRSIVYGQLETLHIQIAVGTKAQGIELELVDWKRASEVDENYDPVVVALPVEGVEGG